MADDTLITGTTVGDISYVVAYYDVNTGNLYDANGNMYGNSTLTTTLDNEFILELHYVQDISTDSDPTTWAVWNGLEGKTVDSSLAFDSDYKHAYEGTSTESTAAASHEIKVTVSSVDKDTLNSEGNLIINPYGLEPEQIPQGSTSTPRMVVPYDSFEYVSSNTSGTVFKFHVADPDGLMYAVPANIQVRVSDPLYLYINPSSIYEVNIPPRYNEGVFKFPMNIMSRKLLKALDYTGVSGVVGTLEHKISVRRDTLTGVSYNSNTYTRDKDKDSTAVYSGDTFLFCAWVNGSSTIWTKGNDVQTNTAVYSISNGTATLLGSTANPVTETDSVLFRTFAFPFLVKNLIDYNATIDIPMQDVDWAKDYIISIIKNNMEEVTGKASTGAYGVVKIANDGTIDVDDGVISIATSLATKQDNMSAIAPVAINNSTVSLNFGDGLDVGVTGTTNANKLIVNEASVKEVLEDVVDGGTEPAVNEIVTADNLKGALSVGQAVDVSCGYRYTKYNEISTDGTNFSPLTYPNDGDFTDTFKGDFWIRKQNAEASVGLQFGFTQAWLFPKRAPNLSYLFILDVDVVSGSYDTTNLDSIALGPNSQAKYQVKDVSSRYGNASEVNTGFKRLAIVFYGDFAVANIGFTPNAVSDVVLHIKNWRQYEVTALTADAISYIAQLPDPDAFFRSTDAYTVRDKYLIKQDMVCPWIPTISMPDNSDLTVAAGLSYKIIYTDNNTHNVTVDTIPTNAYGWDSHIQMFVKGASNVKFKEPLILMDALASNAGHNLIVKYRNGQALVYVDDLNAGNIVLSTTGSTVGTLNYYLQQNPGTGKENYIIFGAVTDGAVCDASSVSVNYNTNVIGNGTDKTTITGAYNVASSKTINFQSLTIDGGTFGGAGTMNLDDVELSGSVNNTTFSLDSTVRCNDVTIPEGSTVYSYGAYNKITWKKLTLNGTLRFRGSVGNYLDTTGYTITGSGTGVLTETDDSSASLNCDTNADYVIENVKIIDNKPVNGLIYTPYSAHALVQNVELSGNTGGNNPVGAVGLWSQTSVTWRRPQLIYKNCNIHDNVSVQWPATNMYARVVNISNFGDLIIDSCNFGVDQHILGAASAPDRYGTITLRGSNIMKNRVTKRGIDMHYLYGFIDPNTTIDCTGSTETLFLNATKFTAWDNITFVTASGTTASFDACVFTDFYTSGLMSDSDGIITITGSTVNPWKATNITFASPLDAAEADTIKLTGTTFTTTAKALNASRIQLPASTTVSFQGNTNAANTKILDASLIVVGDNPASPSGTATVVNASGASSTVSGIGTYIDKEGDNDFVANNTTNVKAVDASTTGAKYLGTVLSATTGDTGANRFAKIDSGAVAVVNEATNAVNKQIITHDYKPILGGTFSLTSATVDEATKTVAIQSGGTMSVVDVRGGKDSVIDLGLNKRIAIPYNQNATLGGVAITGFTGSGGYGTDGVFAAIHKEYDGALNMSGCVISGNTGSYRGTALSVTYGGSATLIDCVIEDNTKSIIDARPSACIFVRQATLNLSGCQIGSGQNIVIMGGTDGNGAYLNLNGSNRIEDFVYGKESNCYVNIASGAIVDLTGNTNATPIAPAGGITFESGGATVYPSAGSASAYILDNVRVPQIGNTNVVNLGGNHPMQIFGTGSSARLVGCTITGGTTPTDGGAIRVYGGATLNMSNVIVSGNACPSGRGGAMIVQATANLTDCVVSGNTAVFGKDIDMTNADGTLTASGCTIGDIATHANNAIVILIGANTIGRIWSMNDATHTTNQVTISSGANITLKNKITPRGPSGVGGIVVSGGTCTINGKIVQPNTYSTIVSSGGKLYVDGQEV